MKNNYSWLQRKLHKFALGSNYIREATFDIERTFITPNNINESNVFVSGLARSGSTILLNAIYESNEFASLSYTDMPFILAPNLWSKISFKKEDLKPTERAHRDGIKITQDSPEAFEEVFWNTFYEDEEDTKEKFANFVQLIKKKYKKKRYLSKNNQNVLRIKTISNIYPDAKILIPFRNPLEQSNSLLYQHLNFLNFSKKDKFISEYMSLIGHREFGPNYKPYFLDLMSFKNNNDPNHWLEQWYVIYENMFETHKNSSNIFFVCYENLCNSKQYWDSLLEKINIKRKYTFSFIESLKRPSFHIDKSLSKKTANLYNKLNKLSYSLVGKEIKELDFIFFLINYL